mmetsp:Transcript_13009/g.48234  ORF Transcript_13009/g.48234 Transcript_13009/m.48234 type:complete len:352 (-) Transcript_13009:291-1346(-)
MGDDPAVGQRVRYGHAVLGILAKKPLDEVGKIGRDFVGEVHVLVIVALNHVEEVGRPARGIKRQGAEDENPQAHSCGPQIGRVRAPLRLSRRRAHLRRPEGPGALRLGELPAALLPDERPQRSALLRRLFLEEMGHAEVGDLHPPIAAAQDVLRLQVAVRHMVLVQVSDAEKHRLDGPRSVLLRQRPLRRLVHEALLLVAVVHDGPVAHELHNHHDEVALDIIDDFHQIDNAGMLQLLHQRHFPGHVVQGRLHDRLAAFALDVASSPQQRLVHHLGCVAHGSNSLLIPLHLVHVREGTVRDVPDHDILVDALQHSVVIETHDGLRRLLHSRRRGASLHTIQPKALRRVVLS